MTAAGPRDFGGQPLLEPPLPPEWMRPAARRKFEEVAAYLVSLRAVTAGEVGLIEQLAAVYGRWVEAELILAKGNLHYRAVLNRQGEEASAVAMPAMMQASKALDQMRKIEAALGLSPAERGRLPAAGGGENDVVDAFFRRAAS